MSAPVLDYWQSAEANLQWSKAEPADYVESAGFLVPRRFKTFEDALRVVRAGGSIMLRSEHRDEYDGPSGLLESYQISPDAIEFGQYLSSNYGHGINLDDEVHASAGRGFSDGGSPLPGYGDVTSMVLGEALDVDPVVTLERLKGLQSYRVSLQGYLSLTRKMSDDFMDAMSYSYWEYIPGTNITVVADDALPSRYHVLASGQFVDQDNTATRYHVGSTLDEGGGTIRNPQEHMLSTVQARMVIKLYEAIRNLGRFNSNHCPIMEMQLGTDGRLYFLQYHKSRDFAAASHRLDPSDFRPQEGWLRADAVRGALDESPATLEMALWYPNFYGSSHYGALQMPGLEDASADYHFNKMLTEVLSRRRIAYVAREPFSEILSDSAEGHLTRGQWFKPKVAVATNDDNLDRLFASHPEIRKTIIRAVYREGRMARAVIDLAADGHDAYIRLNLDSEQPVLTDS